MEAAIGDALGDEGGTTWCPLPGHYYGPLIDEELLEEELLDEELLDEELLDEELLDEELLDEELLDEELLEEELLEEELLDEELDDELEEPGLELDDEDEGIVEDRGTALPGEELGIAVGSVGVSVHPTSPAAVASSVPPDKTSRNSRRRYEPSSCCA